MLETENKSLTKRFDAIGRAIDRCRSEVDVIRSQIGGRPIAVPGPARSEAPAASNQAP